MLRRAKAVMDPFTAVQGPLNAKSVLSIQMVHVRTKTDRRVPATQDSQDQTERLVCIVQSALSKTSPGICHALYAKQQRFKIKRGRPCAWIVRSILGRLPTLPLALDVVEKTRVDSI